MELNLPQAFIDRIKKQLPSEADEFLDSLHNPSAISMRINPKKINKDLSFQQVPWASNGYFLPERPSFVLDPLFHAGCYYVQEASSMMLEHILREIKADKPGLRILDLCAAPGGKSTNILSTISENSILFANETIRSRADILKENILKWGYPNMLVTNNDPSAYSRITGYFDVIVVDAPCSGEGLFRKDAGAVDQWSEGNLKLCCERQERILHDIWPCLKEGGHIIYSTCTFNPDENEGNLIRFMEDHDGASIEVDLSIFPEVTSVDKGGIKGYYAYPHKTRGEGFFISLLQKNASEKEFSPKYRKKQPKKFDPVIPKEVKAYVTDPQHLLNFQETLYLLPVDFHEEFLDISEELNIVTIGTPLAVVKHKNIIPEPSLALSINLKKETFQVVDMPYEEALKFLRKESLDPALLKNGYNLISYRKHSLGWVKKIDDRRMNNNYPKEWRIRMELPENFKELENLMPLT